MKINHLAFLLAGSLLFACAAEKDHLITFETRLGNMYAVLYDETPEHKANFIQLAEEGKYDSTEFHRIIADFMIQGGDVFGKENLPPDEWYTIPAEINEDFFHEKGSIAAARQGDGINPEKRSSGSQFYIVQGKKYDPVELTTNMEGLQEAFMNFLQLKSNKALSDQYGKLHEQKDFGAMNKLLLSHKKEMESFFNTDLSKSLSPKRLKAYTTVGGTPHLDDAYTVFGKIIGGIEVIDKIAAEETTFQDRPTSPVYIKVTVKEMLKKKITNAFGYEYPNKNE